MKVVLINGVEDYLRGIDLSLRSKRSKTFFALKISLEIFSNDDDDNDVSNGHDDNDWYDSKSSSSCGFLNGIYHLHLSLGAFLVVKEHQCVLQLGLRENQIGLTWFRKI